MAMRNHTSISLRQPGSSCRRPSGPLVVLVACSNVASVSLSDD
jgi:hypothetical protein